jgi:menaquinone-dependent protoporphyrinogen oxidase
MRVLVAYGSERGGTAGLAEMIAEELHAAGVGAVARPAAEVRRLDGYDAVVVAGAVYAGRWHKDARRFVREHADGLRRRSVWLASSGPLDDSAASTDVPAVPFVKRVARSLGVQGHVTFGGRLAPDAAGFLAHAMAKQHAGDWRDRDHVRRWVESVAEEMRHPQAA